MNIHSIIYYIFFLCLLLGFFDVRGGGVWVDDMYMGTALLVDYAKLRLARRPAK